MTRRSIRAIAAAFLVLAACSDGAEPPASSVPTVAGSESSPPPDDRPLSPGADDEFRANRVDLVLEPVAEGLTAPVAIATAGAADRLYVAEQGGRIMSVSPTSGDVSEFLDLSGLTEAGGEQGLLGVVFHPDFEDGGRLFVNFTDSEGDSVIAEYTAESETRADAQTYRDVLRFDQPYANHNGGQLAFGPDGFLYIGTGDGGSGGDPEENAQARDTLLGKILRIDVDAGDPYAIPSDNPFADDAGARPEIWALGLRNPWRFSFDRETDRLWIADVGQDILEEINRAPAEAAGLNYGWDEMEGTACYEPPEGCARNGKVLPVTQYSHDFGCSVTGGYVYRGTTWPALRGAYVFGDFCSGTIWAVPADAEPGTRPIELLDTDLAISSFGEGSDGELYLSDLESGRILTLTTPER